MMVKPMRIKAYTLLESIICLLIALMPLSMFHSSMNMRDHTLLNSTFINHYIHQQYASILYHRSFALFIPVIDFQDNIVFNQKGNVLQNKLISLSSKNKTIHISFITGKVYESQP